MSWRKTVHETCEHSESRPESGKSDLPCDVRGKEALATEESGCRCEVCEMRYDLDQG